MLERLLSNGVRTIVVETANRFARDLMVQEVGYAMLKERGIELIAADKPDAFLDDTPDRDDDPSGPRRRLPVREGDAGLEAARRPRSQARDRREGRGPQELTPRSAPKSSRWPSSCPQEAVAARDRGRVGRARSRQRGGKPFTPQSINNMMEG